MEHLTFIQFFLYNCDFPYVPYILTDGTSFATCQFSFGLFAPRRLLQSCCKPRPSQQTSQRLSYHDTLMFSWIYILYGSLWRYNYDLHFISDCINLWPLRGTISCNCKSHLIKWTRCHTFHVGSLATYRLKVDGSVVPSMLASRCWFLGTTLQVKL